MRCRRRHPLLLGCLLALLAAVIIRPEIPVMASESTLSVPGMANNASGVSRNLSYRPA